MAVFYDLLITAMINPFTIIDLMSNGKCFTKHLTKESRKFPGSNIAVLERYFHESDIQ